MLFYIICVLYNKRVSEISSLTNFIELKNKFKNIEIVVVDNSEKEFQQNISLYDIVYLKNCSNLGLSKSYNMLLANIPVDSWILWSDDDTYFSLQYLINAYEIAKKIKFQLFPE